MLTFETDYGTCPRLIGADVTSFQAPPLRVMQLRLLGSPPSPQ